MNRHHLLIAPLILGVSTEICAEDYFDPSLLASDIVGGGDIDLSAFSRPGGGLEGEQEVSIYVNDEFYARSTLNFRNSAEKELLPDFAPDFFDELLAREYRVRRQEGPLSSDEFMAQVPYSSVAFDQGASRVNISIPQAFLGAGAMLASSPDTWDYGVPAFMMDYSLSGNRNESEGYDSRSLYASSQMGLNLLKWRFRTSANYSQYETRSGWGNYRSEQNNFYNTYAERDISALVPCCAWVRCRPVA